MKNFLFIVKFAAIQNMCAICDHFVYIHVALSARTCLPNYQGKFIIEFTRQNFIANFPINSFLSAVKEPNS